jgi:hypothetical protein
MYTGCRHVLVAKQRQYREADTLSALESKGRGDDMMLSRLALAALIAASSVTALPAADDGTADEKPWLNEKAWPALVQPRTFEVKASDNHLARLVKERYNAAQDELRERYTFWLQGIGTLDQVYAAARRAGNARLEVIDPPTDRLTILQEKVEFAKVVERQAEAIRRNRKRAEAPFADEACARYFRLDAEIEFLNAEVEQTAKRADDPALRPPDKEGGRIHEVVDVFASLKAELVAMSADYPQFAAVKAVAIGKRGITYGIVYEHNCGYEDTGPNAVAIGIEVMTFGEFSEKVETVEMQMPVYRWEQLELVGWPRLHFGKDTPQTLAKRLNGLLERHIGMIDQLDRAAIVPTPDQASKRGRLR